MILCRIFLYGVKPLVACALMLGVLRSTAVAAESDAEEMRGWRELSRLQYDSASEVFKTQSGAAALIGKALALLNRPPRTESSVEEADRLLEEAAKDPSAAAAAEYFRARILHVHQLKPDLEKARAAYDRVVRQFPESIFGQMALVKWATLTAERCGPSERDRTFREIEARGSGLQHSDAVRDFHLLLAGTAAHWELPPETSLEHLCIAEKTGAIRGMMYGTVLVRIGELSRQLGLKDEALRAYGDFVRQFPRDERTFTIEQKMKDLR